MPKNTTKKAAIEFSEVPRVEAEQKAVLAYHITNGAKICFDGHEVSIAFSRGSGGRMILKLEEVKALVLALQDLLEKAANVEQKSYWVGE